MSDRLDTIVPVPLAKWGFTESEMTLLSLDATKDPCLKVKCPPHKMCMTHDYQTAICINHNQLVHRPAMQPPQSYSVRGTRSSGHLTGRPAGTRQSTGVAGARLQLKRGNLAHKHWMGPGNLGKCKPCPVTHPSPVCGSDGHTYSSKCKLEFQTCSSGRTMSLKCEGPCPCLPGQEVVRPRSEKNGIVSRVLQGSASCAWVALIKRQKKGPCAGFEDRASSNG
ncbi:UNVERIFIED_CONTAM: hypothetical protein FKN15_017124 [Acipenser sinensis]